MALELPQAGPVRNAFLFAVEACPRSIPGMQGRLQIGGAAAQDMVRRYKRHVGIYQVVSGLDIGFATEQIEQYAAAVCTLLHTALQAWHERYGQSQWPDMGNGLVDDELIELATAMNYSPHEAAALVRKCYLLTYGALTLREFVDPSEIRGGTPSDMTRELPRL